MKRTTQDWLWVGAGTGAFVALMVFVVWANLAWERYKARYVYGPIVSAAARPTPTPEIPESDVERLRPFAEESAPISAKPDPTPTPVEPDPTYVPLAFGPPTLADLTSRCRCEHEWEAVGRVFASGGNESQLWMVLAEYNRCIHLESHVNPNGDLVGHYAQP